VLTELDNTLTALSEAKTQIKVANDERDATQIQLKATQNELALVKSCLIETNGKLCNKDSSFLKKPNFSLFALNRAFSNITCHARNNAVST